MAKGHDREFYGSWEGKVYPLFAMEKGKSFVAYCPLCESPDMDLIINESKKRIHCRRCEKTLEWTDKQELLTIDPELEKEKTKSKARSKNSEYQLSIEPPKGQKREAGGRLTGTWDYTDEKGNLLFQTCKYLRADGTKYFRQRQPNKTKKGGWDWNLKGVRRVIYRLQEIRESKGQVLVCEGEKDCDLGWALGLPSTSCPMGALKWKGEYSLHLSGRDVVLCPDLAPEGLEHMRRVGESLKGRAKTIKWLELPGKDREGYDLSDWYDTVNPGEATAKLKELIEKAPEYEKVPDPTRDWITGLELIQEPIIEPDAPIGGGFCLPERFTIIAAWDGEGKTTLLTQLSLCLITGVPFLGIWPIPKPVVVLYLCAQNSRGDIKNKLLKQKPAIEAILGRNIDKDLDQRLRLVEPKNIRWTLNTTYADELKPLHKTIEQSKAKVIIYDPLGDLVGTSESLNDDRIARKAAKNLQDINRTFGTFAIVSTHLRKRGEKPPQDIHELVHGSRYWLNQSSGHLVITRAGASLGVNVKNLYPKIKTEPEKDTPYRLLFERETLWYSEVKDMEGISEKGKVRPKDVADLLERKYKGEALPSILREIIRDEFTYGATQAKELMRAALKQGYIVKDKNRGVYKVQKMITRQKELELEREKERK